MLRKTLAFVSVLGLSTLTACATDDGEDYTDEGYYGDDYGYDDEDDFGDDDGYDPPPATASVDVTGEWATQWGSSYSDLSLSQSGTSVTGSYSLSTSYGSVSGTITGYTMKGTWSDAYGSGPFTFVFAADGKSFQGTWGDGATWNGTKK